MSVPDLPGVLTGVAGPLLPVVLCVAAGAAFARLGLLPADVRRGVEKLVYWALLPALLIDKLAAAPLTGVGGDVVDGGAVGGHGAGGARIEALR